MAKCKALMPGLAVKGLTSIRRSTEKKWIFLGRSWGSQPIKCANWVFFLHAVVQKWQNAGSYNLACKCTLV